MPYWCSDCRRYFSVKTGTAMERSKLPLRKWGWAIYLEMTNLKGVSSMKLHRDLGVTQTTAWFMLHRIREAFAAEGPTVMLGPVEVDETYVGGKDTNRHKHKKLGYQWRKGKTAVIAAKDRDTNQIAARVIGEVEREQVNAFVDEHSAEDADVYTDGSTMYKSRKNHESVSHDVGEFVRGQVHTNGVESFWAMLKRAYMGVYHRLSAKHLQAYVNQFAGRHNIRDKDTLAQLEHVVLGMVGRRLMYRELVAPSGRESVAS